MRWTIQQVLYTYTKLIHYTASIAVSKSVIMRRAVQFYELTLDSCGNVVNTKGIGSNIVLIFNLGYIYFRKQIINFLDDPNKACLW
jgi:hypothetical protein